MEALLCDLLQCFILKIPDKDAVEKRLFVLQQQGYVTASFDDNFCENLSN